MLTDADIQRIRDDARIARLLRLAANMRRTGSQNGQRAKQQQRDAARKQAALEQARRQYGARGEKAE